MSGPRESATRSPATPPGDGGGLERVLRATADGDRQAFEQLYRLTSAKLFAICRRVLPVAHDAEEALQNAYLNVWRQAASYDPARGRPMTWLITVAHRCAIDILRRRRAAGDAPPLELAAAPAGGSGEGDPAVVRLTACLHILDRPDEALLRAAFFEGATYAEIAGRSATPLGTVKSRIRRALLKLAECLR